MKIPNLEQYVAIFPKGTGTKPKRVRKIPDGIGEWKLVQMVQVTWPRWLPCPNMVKTWKILLYNQKADDLESLYAASSAQVLLNFYIWWPWVDLDLFIHAISCGLKYVRWGKFLREIWPNSVRFLQKSLWSSLKAVKGLYLYVRSLW